MHTNKDKDVLIADLEDALVNEFRIFQSLVELSKNELDALTRHDVQVLLGLVEQKETLLDELGRTEDVRRIITEDLAHLTGLESALPTVSEVVPILGGPVSERLMRIQEGILALGSEIKILNRSNLALAQAALEWADATQAFLLSLYQPELDNYQPPGKYPRSDAAVRSFDQRV
jgi:flagellar biosynthesis/type III secretory pathway chaperone